MSKLNLDNTDNVSSLFYLQLVKDSKFLLKESEDFNSVELSKFESLKFAIKLWEVKALFLSRQLFACSIVQSYCSYNTIVFRKLSLEICK